MGDRELVERLLERDEAALRQVIDTYGGVVFGMARRVLQDPQLAEEVAQDSFVALWRRPGAFDPDRGSLQSFLVGVARNKAIDAVRREEAGKRARDSLAAEMDVASETTSGSEHIVRVEEQQEMRGVLARLSEVQREAIVLAYFGGRTYREVASELGIPEGTAKTRLRDGLLKMRELMTDPKRSE